MQKIVLKQRLAFEDGVYERGDVMTVQNSVAKQLKDNDLVEFVGEESNEQPTPSKTEKNSVTFTSEAEKKKTFDSGTTDKHIAEEKAKPSNVTEVKKEKSPKEK